MSNLLRFLGKIVSEGGTESLNSFGVTFSLT
jgi:hypothetical protein